MNRVSHDGTRWDNADADVVSISPYDPRWPALFAGEARAIRDVLGDNLSPVIEHVGSTAIPGIAAKPIIDIMLGVPSLDLWPRLIAPLESLGYVHWADDPRPGRMFFVKGMPPFGAQRTHHIHVFEISSEQWRVRLLFRDYLRAQPHEVEWYEAVKRQLARQYPTNRDAYTDGKTAYVAEVLRRAQTWQSSRLGR